MKVFQGFEIATAGELRAAVKAERPQDAPRGTDNRARNTLVGALPGEIEIVEASPAVPADQGEAARVSRRVVVDQSRVLGRAGNVAGEVRHALVDLVGTVAEVRCGD